MIGPVSGTGRAMMASLQGAMAKGMPADQAVQYVKSMATQGVAPLADLYAMMNQFQRLKQEKVTPPQTPPTIKDQLNALEQQQQMPQQGGIAQLQAGPPAAQPMDRGLGAIDAGLMEYPRFANGGIVAFDEGGTADSEDSGFFSRLAAGFMGGMGGATGATQPVVSGLDVNRTPLGKATSQVPDEQVASELLNAMLSGDQAKVNDLSMILRDRNRRDLITKVADSIKTSAVESRAAELGVGKPPAAAAKPPVAAPPAPVAERRPAVMGGQGPAPAPADKDITEEQYQKLQAFRKREGLGKAREEYQQFLTGEEKRLAENYGRDKQLAFAEFGFKMAAAASRPGATFLGAMAEGAMSGTQALRSINKELDANKRLLKETMIKLKEADELEKEGDYKAAMGLNREARAEALKLYELRENLKLDREKIRATENATAVSRDYTQQAREDAAYQRKVALREQILSRSAYPTLELQAANTTDPEKQAELQRNMERLMTEANRRAGLVEETEAAAGPGLAKRYRYDMQKGMVPVE